MINRIKYFITTETNPYKNLALEEYLLKQVEEDECLLYLWQNEKTVVIGKNQNPWKECKTAQLEAAGGHLVRRLSGGGAVFHDLGNLNFTFIATKDNYDVQRQLEVIVTAAKLLGIPVEKTGRNDICVEGRKFSGNAFYSDGFHCYHHGTILVKVDTDKMTHYLNVDREKLVSKGIASVRSRVANLTEYVPDLTIGQMREKLVEAFRMVYGQVPERMEASRMDQEQLNKLEQKFSSWDWIYGRRIEFNYSMNRRFPWGDIDLKLEVASGLIRDCIVYSDSLETQLIEQICEVLRGCRFSSDAIEKRMETIQVTDITEMMRNDILEFIRVEGI